MKAIILGEKGGNGMAANHERDYSISGYGTKWSTTVASKWQQLLTLDVAPPALK